MKTDARVEGFDIEVHGGAPEARAVADFYLGGTWRVEPGIGNPRQYDVLEPEGASIHDVGEAWELARKMAEDPRVIRAEPLLVIDQLEPETVMPFAEPAADVPAANWHIEHCAIERAWDIAKGDNIVIGHPDTGYMRHSEIWSDEATQNRILHEHGFDFVRNIDDPLVPAGGSTHGTATASVIMSGFAQNGVHGVAPGAKLIPIRVDDDVVHWRWGRVRKAIEWATAKDVDVISMSLGGPIDGESLHQAIRRAVARGIIVIAAAGNVWPFVVYPAKYPEVLGVAATNSSRRKWGDSARGPAVCVCAPGENVHRATFDNKGAEIVKESSGTSYAAAIVAGVAALWLSHHGRANLMERYGRGNVSAVFRWVVTNHGVNPDPQWDRDHLGAGIIDAERVLRAELPDAGMFHASPLAEPAVVQKSRFADFTEYFPDTPPAQVHAALVQLLNTTDLQLESDLEQFGNELKLHMATSPLIRARIAGTEAAMAVEAGPVESLAISRSLRAKMTGG
jgi:serine protease